VADLFGLLTFIVFWTEIDFTGELSSHLPDPFCQLKTFASGTFLVVAVWTYTAIAVERLGFASLHNKDYTLILKSAGNNSNIFSYSVVVYPFRVRTKRRHAVALSLLCWFFATLLNLPYLFLYSSKSFVLPNGLYINVFV
jgi:hypothetical protein